MPGRFKSFKSFTGAGGDGSFSSLSLFLILSVGLPSNLTETSLKCSLLSSTLKLPPEPSGYSFRCLTSVEHN